MNNPSPQGFLQRTWRSKMFENYLILLSFLFFYFNLIYLNLIFPKVVKSYLAYMIERDIQLPLSLLLTIVIDSFKVWLTRELWVRRTCRSTGLSGWRPCAQNAGSNVLVTSAVAPKSCEVHPHSTDHPAGVCSCPELCQHLTSHVLCGAGSPGSGYSSCLLLAAGAITTGSYWCARGHMEDTDTEIFFTTFFPTALEIL